MQKPFSQACENNKIVIAEQLRIHFGDASHILEIGSGTGQHAVYCAEKLPHLIWQTSDQPQYHAGIAMWLEQYEGNNLRSPLALTILAEAANPASDELQTQSDKLTKFNFDGVFTANTAHIMQPGEVRTMMRLVSQLLPPRGVFCQYGPFTVDGAFTSESNRAFHQSLLAQGCGGYQDIAQLQKWATNMKLTQVVDMPANNLLLVWQRN